VRARLEIER
jgi:DNA replication licensing factor MCM2